MVLQIASKTIIFQTAFVLYPFEQSFLSGRHPLLFTTYESCGFVLFSVWPLNLFKMKIAFSPNTKTLNMRMALQSTQFQVFLNKSRKCTVELMVNLVYRLLVIIHLKMGVNLFAYGGWKRRVCKKNVHPANMKFCLFAIIHPLKNMRCLLR